LGTRCDVKENAMSDNPLDLGDQVKSVAEAADISVDAAGKLGKFVDGAFGGMVSNGIGLIADKLAFYRLQKAVELQHKVETKLAAKGIRNRKFVPVSFGLPILEKASVEEDESLHDKWANLLSNAMDPSYQGAITRNFVSILADMEPIDGRLLDVIVQTYDGTPDKNNLLFDLSKVQQALSISAIDCENAVRNLFRLGVLKPGVVVTSGINLGGYAPTVYRDTELFGLTQLGLAFHAAVAA
jgi:Abortive infection alpha